MGYNYNNIKFDSAKYKSYSFSSIKIQDLEKIRSWRNNQINVLRQNIKISEKQQKNYFAPFPIIKIFSNLIKFLELGE